MRMWYRTVLLSGDSFLRCVVQYAEVSRHGRCICTVFHARFFRGFDICIDTLVASRADVFMKRQSYRPKDNAFLAFRRGNSRVGEI
jgi:hypothetical protein